MLHIAKDKLGFASGVVHIQLSGSGESCSEELVQHLFEAAIADYGRPVQHYLNLAADRMEEIDITTHDSEQQLFRINSDGEFALDVTLTTDSALDPKLAATVVCELFVPGIVAHLLAHKRLELERVTGQSPQPPATVDIKDVVAGIFGGGVTTGAVILAV